MGMGVSAFESLLLGLGLFFVGLQWSGENLNKLAADRLRLQVSSTHVSPWRSALWGMGFGALMQSATAVTFSTVNLVASVVLAPITALPVIVWANVGLTVMAFAVTLNIHPWVAVTVGIAGVLSGLLRAPVWRAAAAALFGVALMLYGLETMGANAALLQALPWFQALSAVTTNLPLLAFAAGIVVAMLLQSNTGAALLIITLAGNGALDVHQAMMMIYGTNLGAIPLRAVLAAGMQGTSARLVRLEDLFCIVSGLLMVSLFYVESSTGWPLVGTAAIAMTHSIKTQLATVFLISNALPALLITPLLPQCWAFLQRLWPDTAFEYASQPKYINDFSLADPSTAFDLAMLELARLTNHARTYLHDPQTAADAGAAFATLSDELGRFLTRLSGQANDAAMLKRQHLLREAFTLIRFIEQSVLEFCATAAALPESSSMRRSAMHLAAVIDLLLGQAGRALHGRAGTEIDALQNVSREHAPALAKARMLCRDAVTTEQVVELRIMAQTLVDDAERIAWMVHRLARLLHSMASPLAQASV